MKTAEAIADEIQARLAEETGDIDRYLEVLTILSNRVASAVQSTEATPHLCKHEWQSFVDRFTVCRFCGIRYVDWATGKTL